MTARPAGAQPGGNIATSVHFDASNILALTGTNIVTLTNGAGNSWTFAAAGQLTISSAGTASFPALGLGAGVMGLYGVGTNILGFATNSIGRWQIDASGNFLAVTDNSFDIGASGATRPRDLYLGGNLRVLTSATGVRFINAHSIIGNANDLSIIAGNGVTDTMIKLVGRLQAGTTTATSADVILNSTNTRTAGWLAQVQNNTVSKMSVKFDGRLFVTVPNSAPTDADLLASQVTFYLIEASNTLQMRVKYSDGTTLKSLTTALALS